MLLCIWFPLDTGVLTLNFVKTLWDLTDPPGAEMSDGTFEAKTYQPKFQFRRCHSLHVFYIAARCVGWSKKGI